MSKFILQKGEKPGQLSIKQSQAIRKKLRYRLSIERIYNEQYYMERMNQKLQISISTFSKDPALQHLETGTLRNVLNSIDILKIVSNNSNDEERVRYRLTYPDSEKIIIITGIKRQFIDRIIQSQSLAHPIKNIVEHRYWIAVELTSCDQAVIFKKKIRNQKKILDEEFNSDYKIGKKRVRIIIQNQDLFTILYDAMSQVLNSNFVSYFGGINPSGLTYTTIQYKNYQETSKTQQEYEDTLSEQQSKNSEIVDGKNIKDCIQMHDQGIQAEKIQDLIKDELQQIGGKNIFKSKKDKENGAEQSLSL